MRQQSDTFTADLFGEPRPVGRPKKPYTLTPAQRQARYRNSEKNRAQARQERFAHLSDVTLARYMADSDNPADDRRELWLEFGRRLGWR